MRVCSFRSGASIRRAFSSTPWYESSQIQLPGQPLEDDEPKRPFRHWYPIPKKLEEMVKLPLLSREDPTTIRSLWLERFGSSPKIVVGVMAREEYDSWETNARACPMFICPVPRPGGGYINLVTQYNGQQVLCSFLEQSTQLARMAGCRRNIDCLQSSDLNSQHVRKIISFVTAQNFTFYHIYANVS